MAASAEQTKQLIAVLERVEQRLIAVEAMLQAEMTARDSRMAQSFTVASEAAPKPARRRTKKARS